MLNIMKKNKFQNVKAKLIIYPKALSLIFIIIFVIGSWIGLSLWDEIILPFSNPYNVVGPLTVEEFNPNTNFLRYIVLLSIPSLVAFVTVILFKNNFRLSFKEKNHSVSNKYAYGIILLSVVMIIVFVFQFLNQPFRAEPLDIFHTGEQLTPAFNYLHKGGIWRDSLFVHGAIRDTLITSTTWKIFNTETIGLSQIAMSISSFGPYISFMLLIISIVITFGHKKADLYGTLISVIFFVIFLYTHQIAYASTGREPVMFISLAVFLFALVRSSKIGSYISGLLVALNLLYSIDIGAYYFALIVTTIIVSIFLSIFNRIDRNALKLIPFILAGLVTGFVFIQIVFGSTEFKYFLGNTLMLFKTKDLYDAYIYRNPLVDIKAGRPFYYLPILSISLGLFYFVIKYTYLFFVNKKFNSKHFFIHFLVVIAAVVFYRSALGRSDEGHIRYSALFGYLSLGFIIADLIYSQKEYYIKLAILFFIGMNFSLVLVHTRGFIKENIYTSFERMEAYAKLDDTYFLNTSEVAGVSRLREIFNEEECIYSMTSQAAVPYLIRKPSCTKHFVVWFASADPYREELLGYLETEKPKFILYSSDDGLTNFDGISNRVRFSELYEYIDKNYSYYETVEGRGWVVYKSI